MRFVRIPSMEYTVFEQTRRNRDGTVWSVAQLADPGFVPEIPSRGPSLAAPESSPFVQRRLAEDRAEACQWFHSALGALPGGGLQARPGPSGPSSTGFDFVFQRWPGSPNKPPAACRTSWLGTWLPGTDFSPAAFDTHRATSEDTPRTPTKETVRATLQHPAVPACRGLR